jgi:catabolite regulation protein CreA
MTKTIILSIFLAFIISGTAYAGAKIIDAEDVARVGIGKDAINISKFVDGENTCYVTRHGKFGAHAIACVK